jgi:GLUG motif-containing protein
MLEKGSSKYFWVSVFVVFSASGVFGQYSGGSGTEGDPYRIANIADWQALLAASGDWNKHFQLTNDIDFGGINLTPVAPDTSTSGGFQGTPFTGVFDGDGFVLRNATIDMSGTAGQDYVGLFGYLGSGAQLLNLGTEAIDVNGQYYVGGLVGYNDSGTITSCYTTGSASGYSYIGGLVGLSYDGTINQCYTTGEATSGSGSSVSVGGLVGDNTSGTITDCYTTGTVTGASDVGGLCGWNDGTISESYATGVVSGETSVYRYVGGLVGQNYGIIINCYTTGAVTGNNYVGGLVGYNESGEITSCYITGEISGNNSIGGLVGLNESGTITTCYVNGSVAGNSDIGGFVGNNHQGKIIHCYSTGKPTGSSDVGGFCGSKVTGGDYEDTGNFWDADASQTTTSAMGTDKTTTQMQDINTFLTAQWDFSSTDGDPADWWMPSNDYPRLAWQEQTGPYSGGSGTETDPYQISTVADWQELMSTPADWGSYFLLTDDIDLMGITVTPVGNESTFFNGVFDGDGHVISNATINLPTSNYVGIFGFVGSGGQIENLGAENVQITGQSDVGGLVGANLSSTITACYATGSVSGSEYWIGGLCGLNAGTITASYATSAVSGGQGAGGLVGYNQFGTITACYAVGNVTGEGGLCGVNWSGTVTASVWDKDTTGKNGSAAGKGLTTGQMKTISIFQNAGWSQYAWVMEDDPNYPRLAWENTIGLPIPTAPPIPLSGAGTQNDPYLVGIPAEFALLSWHVSILDKHLKLTADIDLAGILLYPIGDLGPFTGDFDGDGFVIRNAVINQPTSDYVGLFNSVASGGQIHNLGVEDVDITGHRYVGGMTGWNGGTIALCHATGSVSGSSYDIGGMVGLNYGTITACYATDSVNGGSYAGGLAGGNNGTIMACYATGAVDGWEEIGGLIGENYQEGKIIHCYSTGEPTGNANVGGLCGNTYIGEGYEDTGNFWDADTSQTTTSAMGTDKTTAQMQDINTFLTAGWDFSETDGDPADWWMPGNDYPRLVWEVQTGPYSGGSGTEADPYQISTVADWQELIDTTADWDKYFRLMNNIDFDGIALTPVAPDTSTSDYYQGTPFNGVFDGNGHVIYNAIINLPAIDYVSLFGFVGSGGQIRNLGAENVQMNGQRNVGGLVGWNLYGTITDCYVTGAVSGSSNCIGGLAGYNFAIITDCYASVTVSGVAGVGGLVGYNDYGKVTACYASGDVSGDDVVGGLMGDNAFGTVMACYATGAVGGDNYVGGLIGDNTQGKIIHCYSTGKPMGTSDVGGLCGSKSTGGNYEDTGNFWDADTSQTTTSAMGTDKTTAQMKTRSTFTTADWDFVNVWGQGQKQTYPYLRTGPSADLNNDGKVNLVDYALFCSQWLAGTD